MFKSVEDLKSYNFVALVKIDKLPPLDTAQKYMQIRTAGNIEGKVLEHFKGDMASNFNDPSFESDCALGLKEGEEWLFFGYIEKGKIQISRCSYTVKYKTVYGERDWRYFRGINELDVLRRIFGHSISTNFAQRQFYPNGNLELTQRFKYGKLTGKRTFYDTKGKIELVEDFKNGVRVGYRRGYDTSGHLIYETKYRRGIQQYAIRFQDTAETAWYLNYQKKNHDQPIFGERGHNEAYFVKLLDSLRKLKHWDRRIASKYEFSKDGLSYRQVYYDYKGTLVTEAQQDWDSKINESCHYYSNGKLQYTVIVDGKNNTEIEYDYDVNGNRKNFQKKCDYCYLYFDKDSPQSQPEKIYIQ